ncbi:DUF1998 domain-containing protein [Bacillus sp. B6(2022)]|nr:DUF1998 domain-containing protein [Bacillus sp. B6(2022)]
MGRNQGDYAAVVEGAHQNMYKERDVPEKAIPPFKGLRYVLLHTLSHALIRELTLHSGYSSSALKERIYSDKEAGMAGILIYTSTVDSEGSLGGLVELGNKAKFEAIMARALAAAGYCSGDPQCGEYDEHTLTNVNGAACHSCMLISEISCESSNRYLDRALLVETIANKDRAFLVDKIIITEIVRFVHQCLQEGNHEFFHQWMKELSSLEMQESPHMPQSEINFPFSFEHGVYEIIRAASKNQMSTGQLIDNLQVAYEMAQYTLDTQPLITPVWTGPVYESQLISTQTFPAVKELIDAANQEIFIVGYSFSFSHGELKHVLSSILDAAKGTAVSRSL